jgi:hypothetical protein
MPPGEHHIVQPNARGVDAELRLVYFVVVVLIVLERVGAEDDAIVKCAANRELVTYDVPLSFCTVEEQVLAEVVDEANELHPPGLSIIPQCLRSFEEMGQLRLLGVWVTFIDKCVQLLERFPDSHLSTRLATKFLPCFLVEGRRLKSVLLSIEGFHAVTGVVELPEGDGIFLLVEFGLLVDVVLTLVNVHMVDVV